MHIKASSPSTSSTRKTMGAAVRLHSDVVRKGFHLLIQSIVYIVIYIARFLLLVCDSEQQKSAKGPLISALNSIAYDEDGFQNQVK